MRKVAFLVDGFNVYHSLKDAQRDLDGQGTRWLNLRSLLDSYVSSAIGGGAQLESIDYFTARPTHLAMRKPGIVARQALYLQAIESTGVRVTLGQFTKGRHYCSTCTKSIKRFEEKESDVAIAAKLFEHLHSDDVDIVVVVTGDTDLVPAIRTARRLYPAKSVYSAFPYRRENKELRQTSEASFNIRKEQYAKHQLPNPVVLKGGRELAAPTGW